MFVAHGHRRYPQGELHSCDSPRRRSIDSLKLPGPPSKTSRPALGRFDSRFTGRPERTQKDEGISVDEIVEAANVAKGTFYVHFPSKEHLLAALEQRFALSFADLIDTAIAKRRTNDWRGQLNAWVKAGVNGYLDRVALHDVVFHEIHVGDRRLKHKNVVVKQLAVFLGAGACAGAWSVTEPHLTAVMLFGANPLRCPSHLPRSGGVRRIHHGAAN